MKLLTISQVKPGMRTAKAIADRAGNTLTNVGIELTEGMIERLKSRRIEFVYVEEEGADGGKGVPADEIALREADIDRTIDSMFAGQTDSEIMAALADIGKRYRKRKLR